MTGVVVGVDGSNQAAHALRWAVREGQLHQWPVTAVMAWRWLAEYHDAVGDNVDPVELETIAAAALEARVEEALGTPAAASVAQRALNEIATRALLDASLDASLLVVGARGLGNFRGLLLGSVSQQCLHHAPCPIAIVRGGPGRTEGERIVVGIDGSQTARGALEWAAEEARLRRAALDVVHAWHPPNLAGYPAASSIYESTDLEQAARKTLDTALDTVINSGLHQPPNGILVKSGAAAAILATGDGADLVVVGSRGRGGFAGLLLGSVSERVAHHANCPVVVVRRSS